MLVFLFFVIFSPICAFLIVAIPFQLIKVLQKPKLNKDWFGLFKELPQIVIDKNNVIYVKNVRNARYNPNYEYECRVQYLSKRYKLDDLEKAWLFVNPYGPLQSHVILSFQFGHDNIVKNFLTVSYELRKTDPQDFKFTSVIFNNFEGHYILAPEEDTIYVRTNVRHNYEDTRMYMFPLNISKDTLRDIFLDMAHEINMYNKHPKFYRVYSRSCVTEIFKFFRKHGIVNYRTNLPLSNILKFLYNSKLIDGNENISFAQFRKKYFISGKSKGLQANENFPFELRNRTMWKT